MRYAVVIDPVDDTYRPRCSECKTWGPEGTSIDTAREWCRLHFMTCGEDTAA